ncbi:protein kinase [Microbispora cellulosiformans]|uniref:non-specific serine/threonine protein kinase n=1 Tax=Microbispora cellulosiformans TaxID=2614688 RepID=A0A5J5K6W5_9ACTN|nr:serine/threonine-protein kinase [Microbispora cellulosiformans]KAA9379920.1 protein kinase [Microbispora cellulosiformans]
MDEERRVAGRYRLLEPIGRGGMGVVWRAHDDLLARTVAVKEVLYHPTSEEDRDTFNRRTIREARAAGRIDHPNVVVVHDVIEEDGRPWIVMQLVQSRSLGQELRDQGPLPPDRVAAIGLQVLDALCTAHAAGVLHRDVKPENVLLSGETRVVLTDFGIATMPEETGLTMTGGITGTPAFLPPERLNGYPATPESDLWSLGATLYAAVEGRTPFDRNSAVATMAAVLHDDPAPPLRAGALTPVLEGLLRKDPAHRISPGETAALLNAAIAAGPGPAAAAPPPGSWRPNPSGPQQPSGGSWQQTPPGSPLPPGGSHWHPHPSGPQQPSGAHWQQTPPGAQPYGGPWHGAPPGPGQPGSGAYGAASTHPPHSLPPAPPQSPARRGPAGRVALLVLIPVLLVGVVAGGWFGYQQFAAGPAVRDSTSASENGTTGDTTGEPTGDSTGDSTSSDGAGEPSPHTGTSSGPPSPEQSAEPSQEPSQEPSAKPSPRPPATVPAGWKVHRDPLGFSIALPSGWVPYGREATRVRFHAPNGRDYLQVDLTPWETDDPVSAVRTVEEASTEKGYLRGYERIGITPGTYLGVPSADWEFTHTVSTGKVRVLDRAFRLGDGRCVALYWQVSDARWTSGLSYFKAFTRTFQPG